MIISDFNTYSPTVILPLFVRFLVQTVVDESFTVGNLVIDSINAAIYCFRILLNTVYRFFFSASFTFFLLILVLLCLLINIYILIIITIIIIKKAKQSLLYYSILYIYFRP